MLNLFSPDVRLSSGTLVLCIRGQLTLIKDAKESKDQRELNLSIYSLSKMIVDYYDFLKIKSELTDFIPASTVMSLRQFIGQEDCFSATMSIPNNLDMGLLLERIEKLARCLEKKGDYQL